MFGEAPEFLRKRTPDYVLPLSRADTPRKHSNDRNGLIGARVQSRRWPSTSPSHFFAALPELRIHPTAKRIRAFVDGDPIVDSTRAMIVLGAAPDRPQLRRARRRHRAASRRPRPRPPPRSWRWRSPAAPVLDPRTPFAVHTVGARRSTSARRDTHCPNAAFVLDDPDLDGYAIVDFDAFDEWREEDELVVAHARDPFGTVDTRRSSRRVVVVIGGTTVADSTNSVMLFETYLPTRYYLPREDVRMDLLEPPTRRPPAPTKASPRTGRRTSTARC